MLWPAGGGALCPASVSLSLSQTRTHACKRVLESLLWRTCPLCISFPPIHFSTRVESGFFLGWSFKVLSISEGIRCVQRQTQQDKRLCLDSRLSDSSPHSQPLLYLGGCYREGRWLITINRTERESEWASEWVRGPCTSTNRTTPPRTKELGGRC